jgi:hypothetical protein
LTGQSDSELDLIKLQDESCIRIMDRRIQIIEIYENEIHSFHVTRSNHIQGKGAVPAILLDLQLTMTEPRQ